MQPDTLGLAISVLAHSEIVLRHSPGLHLCPPDPLLQALDWTLPSASPLQDVLPTDFTVEKSELPCPYSRNLAR